MQPNLIFSLLFFPFLLSIPFADLPGLDAILEGCHKIQDLTALLVGCTQLKSLSVYLILFLHPTSLSFILFHFLRCNFLFFRAVLLMLDTGI